MEGVRHTPVQQDVSRDGALLSFFVLAAAVAVVVLVAAIVHCPAVQAKPFLELGK